MGIPLDLHSFSFEGITPVSRVANDRHHKAQWLCTCACGRAFTVRAADLVRGRVISCGCVRANNAASLNRTHRLSDTPLHYVWRGMKARCNNPHCKAYANYGGRGIKVCERWQNSFENFLADMGPKPTPSHTVERIDNDGNYEPSNCKWATRLEQSRNTRRTKRDARWSANW